MGILGMFGRGERQQPMPSEREQSLASLQGQLETSQTMPDRNTARDAVAANAATDEQRQEWRDLSSYEARLQAEIESREARIAYLEATLARTTNPERRVQLEARIERFRAGTHTARDIAETRVGQVAERFGVVKVAEWVRAARPMERIREGFRGLYERIRGAGAAVQSTVSSTIENVRQRQSGSAEERQTESRRQAVEQEAAQYRQRAEQARTALIALNQTVNAERASLAEMIAQMQAEPEENQPDLITNLQGHLADLDAQVTQNDLQEDRLRDIPEEIQAQLADSTRNRYDNPDLIRLQRELSSIESLVNRQRTEARAEQGAEARRGLRFNLALPGLPERVREQFARLGRVDLRELYKQNPELVESIVATGTIGVLRLLLNVSGAGVIPSAMLGAAYVERGRLQRAAESEDSDAQRKLLQETLRRTMFGYDRTRPAAATSEPSTAETEPATPVSGETTQEAPVAAAPERRRWTSNAWEGMKRVGRGFRETFMMPENLAVTVVMQPHNRASELSQIIHEVANSAEGNVADQVKTWADTVAAEVTALLQVRDVREATGGTPTADVLRHLDQFQRLVNDAVVLDIIGDEVPLKLGERMGWDKGQSMGEGRLGRTLDRVNNPVDRAIVNPDVLPGVRAALLESLQGMPLTPEVIARIQVQDPEMAKLLSKVAELQKNLQDYEAHVESVALRMEKKAVVARVTGSAFKNVLTLGLTSLIAGAEVPDSVPEPTAQEVALNQARFDVDAAERAFREAEELARRTATQVGRGVNSILDQTQDAGVTVPIADAVDSTAAGVGSAVRQAVELPRPVTAETILNNGRGITGVVEDLGKHVDNLSTQGVNFAKNIALATGENGTSLTLSSSSMDGVQRIMDFYREHNGSLPASLDAETRRLIQGVINIGNGMPSSNTASGVLEMTGMNPAEFAKVSFQDIANRLESGASAARTVGSAAATTAETVVNTVNDNEFVARRAVDAIGGVDRYLRTVVSDADVRNPIVNFASKIIVAGEQGGEYNMLSDNDLDSLTKILTAAEKVGGDASKLAGLSTEQREIVSSIWELGKTGASVDTDTAQQLLEVNYEAIAQKLS